MQNATTEILPQALVDLSEIAIGTAENSMRDHGRIPTVVFMDVNGAVAAYSPTGNKSKYRPLQVARFIAESHGAKYAVALVEMVTVGKVVIPRYKDVTVSPDCRCAALQIEGPGVQKVQILPMKWDANGSFAELERNASGFERACIAEAMLPPKPPTRTRQIAAKDVLRRIGVEFSHERS